MIRITSISKYIKVHLRKCFQPLLMHKKAFFGKCGYVNKNSLKDFLLIEIQTINPNFSKRRKIFCTLFLMPMGFLITLSTELLFTYCKIKWIHRLTIL